MPATSGFESVTADVERAVKTSARDALPETTKVTVVQQETHLPPAQFNAPQQVANAVVTFHPQVEGGSVPSGKTDDSTTPRSPRSVSRCCFVTSVSLCSW